jgi:hypothetical protein
MPESSVKKLFAILLFAIPAFAAVPPDLAELARQIEHFPAEGNQLEVFPGRVQHGLLSELLNVGEPKATRMYFEARRAQAQPVSPETPDYYRAMLEGRCRQVQRCSPRLMTDHRSRMSRSVVI